MAQFDLTAAAALMKELYSPDDVQELVLTDRPGLALCPKDEGFVGSHVNQPTLIGNPQNTSNTFLTGQGGTTTSTLKGFLVTRVTNYGFAYIDNQLIQASKTDAGAFAEGLEVEMDGALNSLSNQISQQFYRSGWGAIGTIGTISGTTITLSQASSTFNFEIGMNLVFAATESTSALRSGTAVSVTAVNRAAGTIVISATTGSPANSDIIFRAGDRQNSAAPTRIAISGIEAWVPFTAPTTGDSFFGVDRSVDSRLYGNSIDGSAVPLEEVLQDGIRASVQNGGSPDYIFMNPVQVTALSKALGSKVEYVDVKLENSRVGFRGIQVQGEKGPVKIMSDIWCPGDRAYVVESKSMLLHSLGPVPDVWSEDGLQFLRSATADGVDVRLYAYPQLRIKQPSHFCTIKLGAA